ncbi:MAG: hypothetical protein IKV32_00495 [Muribaculaceae bacterium]|nr:hypothetical protein [Muribaculaceae bacterium]
MWGGQHFATHKITAKVTIKDEKGKMKDEKSQSHQNYQNYNRVKLWLDEVRPSQFGKFDSNFVAVNTSVTT